MSSSTQPKCARLCIQDSNSGLSPLEELPTELAWMVIEYASESVCELRLTSHQLKLHVDNLTLQPNSIPLVKSMRFTGYDGPTGIKGICIHVPEERAKLFELRITLQKLAETTIKKKRRNWDSASENFNIHYDFGFNNSQCRDGWLHYFQCFGKTFEKLELKNCITPSAFHFISTLLEGIRCKRVEVDKDVMNECDLQFLLNFIGAHNVSDVLLYARQVNHSDPGMNFKFELPTSRVLYEVSKLVRTLRIYQYRNIRMNVDNSFFFGVQNADWGQIILKMFSRKLEKLRIRNNLCSEYLSSVGTEVLREKLPKLGKKIWFEASCINHAELIEYEINEHNVKVEQSGLSSTMSVKHSSRKDESRHF